MDFLQTLIFAIVQGITELFPVSSVAHGVITPYVFHWQLSPAFLKEHFLPYVVMLHLGTSIALFGFFWKEWAEMIRSLFDRSRTESRRVLWMVIVGTLPAAVLGFALEKPLKAIFSSVTSAAIFLILNGLLLFFGEKMRSKGNRDIGELTFAQATLIGFAQSFALVPGFSRSGASMTAGFWMGLKHEAAARFSMLLATPIILGAAVLEVPKLVKTGSSGLLQMSLIGGVFSGIFAYIAVSILMHWFKKNEVNAMRPFAYYCWAVGAIILVTLYL